MNNNHSKIGEDYSNVWKKNSNTVWLASSILLHRNIEKFNFPGKLDLDRRKQVISLISRDLSSLKGIEGVKLLKGEECTPFEKEFLVEHSLTEGDYHQAHQGEGFIIDKMGEFFITLNIKDHLHFYTLDCQGELESAWNRLVKLETQLGKSFAYAYSQKFGFLTADPFVCGTALIVSAYLQVSALIHTGKLKETLKNLGDEAIYFGTLQGDSDDLIGDIVKVKNNYTLGLNEETILSSVRSFVTKIIVEENAARKEIKQGEAPDVKDKVSRAYGLLVHSYQIEEKEALNEIALLKLGLEFGWLKGIDMVSLNKLFLDCRRAHLLKYFSEKISHEEVAHKRAEFIHKSLKNVALTV